MFFAQHGATQIRGLHPPPIAIISIPLPLIYHPAEPPLLASKPAATSNYPTHISMGLASHTKIFGRL